MNIGIRNVGLLVLLLNALDVQSNPDGAPTAACIGIYPVGHVDTPRHLPNNGSFSLNTEIFSGGIYIPGNNYTRKLSRTVCTCICRYTDGMQSVAHPCMRACMHNDASCSEVPLPFLPSCIQ